jgi:hypothetical protein
MEWEGIRAAAGYLPGQKLAVSIKCEPTTSNVQALGAEIGTNNPKRIIFHGFSPLMESLVYYLSDWGYTDRLFVVVHGSSAQWHDDFDRQLAFTCLRLAGEGRIRRLHFLRRGFDFPVDRLFKPMLFNISPQVLPSTNDETRRLSLLAFVPGRKLWTKNIFTNIVGAATSDLVSRVRVYANTPELPYPLAEKVAAIKFSQAEKLATYSDADIVLNVSTLDNHPMINIEAQTMQRACLRGPLFLDALEHHSYVSLTTVRDTASIREIREAIVRVAAVPPLEMMDIIKDYQTQSDSVSLQRYGEFLEL